MILHGDFETRSTVDLEAAGLDTYAKHGETDVWCFAYAFDDEPVDVWTPGDGFPERIREHILKGGVFVGHSVGFEFAIWNEVCARRYGWPILQIDQCECTAAMAYAMGLPGSLESAAPAAGIEARKDATGKRLMLQMCRPRSTNPLVWWDSPEQIDRLIEYCKQDVEVERQLYKRLVPLSAAERKVWLLDQEINGRGIAVDRAAIEAAQGTVFTETDRLNARLRELTGNYVGFVTEVARLTDWIRQQGVDIPGVSKPAILDALKDDDLPAHVREVLQLRQEVGRASVAKLGKMLSAASADGRVRGVFQYHGASTGRWAGRRIQPHNFPRPTLEPEQIAAAFDYLENPDALENFFGRPVDVIVNCLRGMLIAPPGKDLLVGDYANIEGRILAWEAGEEWKLQAFRNFDAGTGPDIYKLTYAQSFGVPVGQVDKDQRQIGKVEELALGYGGGVGAFQTMAKAYGVRMADERAEEIKQAWRAVHPATVAYWRDVERAAIAAVQQPGVFAAGPKGREVKFRKSGSFLWCRLPSGRAMCYPYPKIVPAPTPWGEDKPALTYFTVVSPGAIAKVITDPNANGTWQRVSTYGGSLVENITQAVARDVLAEAMLRLDEAGFPIVLHVHDEAVCEVPEHSRVDVALATFKRDLAKTPAWAPDLPIAVECWRGKRHRK